MPEVNIFLRPGRSHVWNWQKLVCNLKIWFCSWEKSTNLQTCYCFLSFQMPRLLIAPCYEEILVDPSLWWLFPEGEWRCAHSSLGALWCQIVSEQPFAHLSSPLMWRQARVDVISSSSEIVPLVVLITDRVEEGSLGMMTTFCDHDQAKVESLDVHSTLCQWDSPKPSMVVVRIFANSPFLPWGSFGLPYLDVTALPEGALAFQFPLEWLSLGICSHTLKHSYSAT